MKWAMNKDGLSVPADEARDTETYYCEDCREPVSLRGKTARREAGFAHYPGSKCAHVESKSHLLRPSVALTTLTPDMIGQREKLYLALLQAPEFQLVEMDRVLPGVEWKMDISFVYRSRAMAVHYKPGNMRWQDIDKILSVYTARTYPVYSLWTAPLPETLKEGEPYILDEWEQYIHALSYGSILYHLDQTAFFAVHFEQIEVGNMARMPFPLGVCDIRDLLPHIRRESFIAPPFELGRHAILYKRRKLGETVLVKEPERAFQ